MTTPDTAHGKAALRVGIGGLGTVGLPVAKWLDGETEAGLTLAAVASGNKERALERVADFNTPVPVVELGELADCCDVIVECAPPGKFEEIADPAIQAGRIFMPLSVTSLLDRMDLIETARQTGARIIVPTGALLGLDALRAAALGTIHSVTMITRKPPRGLAKATFVIEQGIDLDGLTEPKKLFQGYVSEAAALFPANVNVAVAVGLAGIGPDKTEYEIWADPGVTRNTHTIKVDADTVHFEMTIANVPTEENPATGKLVPLSVIETLRGLVTPFKVGT
ncbi:MAG: aspartate dehydrogenase [Proteobacteria bacterium]|nr:aspartate dehydrogenase [Pseudomonadota bacterium]